MNQSDESPSSPAPSGSSEGQQPRHPLLLPVVPPEPERPSWNLGDFFLFFLLQYIFSFLLYGLFTMFIPSPDKILGRYFTIVATLSGNIFVLLLYGIRARKYKRFSWTELGWRLPSQQNAIFWIAVFFVLVFGFNSVYQILLKWFDLGQPKQEIASFFGPNQPMLLKATTLLLVAIVAPLTEEILYRGVLFSAVAPHIPPHTAAMATGLLFGVIHFEPHTILPLAFLGYLLCLVYHYTRSLWLCVGLHATNNIMAFLILIWSS